MPHFARSDVSKERVSSSCAPRRLEASVLLYFLFSTLSFCRCSWNCSSTSATVVNLHIRTHTRGHTHRMSVINNEVSWSEKKDAKHRVSGSMWNIKCERSEHCWGGGGLTSSGGGPDWCRPDSQCRTSAVCASTQAARLRWELLPSALPVLKRSLFPHFHSIPPVTLSPSLAPSLKFTNVETIN